MHIGVIGCGIMSKNIIINLIKKNIYLSIYNKEFIKLYLKTEKILLLTNNLNLFVKSLRKNKIIFLLIKSGKPVKIVLIKLKKKLNNKDIVIDFGNSYFKNTILNYKIVNKNFIFLSSGISGGANGALYGLCIMIDCSIKIFKIIKNFLNLLILKNKNSSLSISLGISSSHFLKMLHNGIEYGILQIISEIFFLIKIIVKKNYLIINIFYKINKKLKLFLLKILLNIIIKKKKKIIDIIDQKGTGLWCCVSTIKNCFLFNTLIEALIIRIISKKFIFRNLIKKINYFNIKINLFVFIENIKKIVFLNLIINYFLGFSQLKKIKKKYNWKFNLNNIIKSFLKSCIIDSKILILFLNKKKTIKKILKSFKKYNLIFKKIIFNSIKLEINLNIIISCYNFFLIFVNNNFNFKIIQLQRNFFGNHFIKKI